MVGELLKVSKSSVEKEDRERRMKLTLTTPVGWWWCVRLGEEWWVPVFQLVFDSVVPVSLDDFLGDGSEDWCHFG